MKSSAMAFLSALVLAGGLGGANAIGQSGADTVDAHVAAAKAAADTYHVGLFTSLCSAANIQPPSTPQRGPRAGGPGGTPPGPPERSTWHAEPVKVFDNLYFVGMTEYSAWAVKTSDGIILLDTIYDYSIEDEVAGGLKKLGLDPATIKYALVSHGHIDHFGGAKYLQEHFGTKVLMSAADWELIAASRNQNKPTRDMVVTDGQKLTLGDTTLDLHADAGSHARHGLDADSRQGQRHAAPRRRMGRHRIQLPRAARRRSGPTPRPPRSSATSPRRPAPTRSSRITPSSTGRRPRFPRWRCGSPAIRIRT